jgi:hypothetical protein
VIACAALLAAAGVITLNDTLDPSSQSGRRAEGAPQPPTHLPPSDVTLRLSDLPRGFVIDYANTSPVSWHDLAGLATKRRLALLRHNGLIAEYDASFYRTSSWQGQPADFLGVRTVATTFKTVSGAQRVFDDPHNPLLSLTHSMRRIRATANKADERQEATHTDSTGHTTILVRWRAGRTTGGLVLFGSGPSATTTYATTVALISLRRALHSTRRSA